MGKIALGVPNRRRKEHRMLGDPRRSGGQCKRDRNRGNSVPRLRQDDPVSVVVGGDEFADVISRHPMTVGRNAGTQCPEDQEQEAGQHALGG